MSFFRNIMNRKVSEFLDKNEQKSIGEHIAAIKADLLSEDFEAVVKKFEKGVMTSSTEKTYYSSLGAVPVPAPTQEGCRYFVEIMLFADYLYVYNFKAFCELVDAFDKTPATRACFVTAIENRCFLPTLKLSDNQNSDPRCAYVGSLFTWSLEDSTSFQASINKFSAYAKKVQSREAWKTAYLPNRLAPKAPIGNQLVVVAEGLTKAFEQKKAQMEEGLLDRRNRRTPEQKFALMKLKLDLVDQIGTIRNRSDFAKDRNYSNTVIFLSNFISGLVFIPFGIANIAYHCKTGNWLLFDRASTRGHTTAMARVGGTIYLKPKFKRLSQSLE